MVFGLSFLKFRRSVLASPDFQFYIFAFGSIFWFSSHTSSHTLFWRSKLKYRGTVILTWKIVLNGRKTACFGIVMRYKAERLIPLSSTTGRIFLDFPWEIWPAFLFPILFPYFFEPVTICSQLVTGRNRLKHFLKKLSDLFLRILNFPVILFSAGRGGELERKRPRITAQA